MPAARQWAYKRRRKIMGFRIRKSISFGKGFRVNLGKSGITSVTFGKRGAPHITTGRRGTRFGTPVVPGTGISYEKSRRQDSQGRNPGNLPRQRMSRMPSRRRPSSRPPSPNQVRVETATEERATGTVP